MSGQTADHAALAFRVYGVRHSFGQAKALHGIDLDVGHGEVLVVTGSPGSGKSTPLHVVAGVFPPDEGSIEYEGADITGLDEAERSDPRLRFSGFVFQPGQLLSDLSAIGNATIPLLLAGWRRKNAPVKARDVLEELDVTDHRDKRPGELSGGQAQRVAVARALVTESAVLFADEPTGSLDILAAEKTVDSPLDPVWSRGTTMVIVTHDPRIAPYADREAIVRDGTVGFGGGVENTEGVGDVE